MKKLRPYIKKKIESPLIWLYLGIFAGIGVFIIASMLFFAYNY